MFNFENGKTPLSAEVLNKAQKELKQETKEELQTQINSLSSGSPLVANSIEEMTDTTRVYVNTKDGHWYTYNGSTWVDGGVYQATEISDESITPDKLSNTYNEFIFRYGEISNTALQSDGTTINSNVNKTSDFYPVKKGIIELYSNVNFLNYVLYDTEKNPINVYPYTSSSLLKSISSYSKVNHIKCEDGYIRVTTRNADIDNVKIINFNYANSTIINENIENGAINNQKDNSDFSNITGFKNLSSTIFNSTNVIASANNTAYSEGTECIYSGWLVSDFIDVSNFCSIYIKVTTHKLINAISFFDESYNYISGFTTTESGNVDIEKYVDVPDKAKYFKVSNYTTTSSYTILGLTNILKSRWNGKKLACLGDSITYGVGGMSFGGYVKYLSELLGCASYVNYGVSGTKICGTGSTSFVSRYSDMDNDADIITVLGGVNDFMQVRTSETSFTFGDMNSTDNMSFYGALKNLINGLIDKYPTKDIIFITPLKTKGYIASDVEQYAWNEPNALGKTLEDYRNAIIEVCEYYSIPVLDLFSLSGISVDNENSNTTYLTDGLHPNALGYSKIAKKIATFINSI